MIPPHCTIPPSSAKFGVRSETSEKGDVVMCQVDRAVACSLESSPSRSVPPSPGNGRRARRRCFGCELARPADFYCSAECRASERASRAEVCVCRDTLTTPPSRRDLPPSHLTPASVPYPLRLHYSKMVLCGLGNRKFHVLSLQVKRILTINQFASYAPLSLLF